MNNKVITLEQLQKALLREEVSDKKELEALSQEIKDFISTLDVKQVQPDWEQDDIEAVDFIKNKPDIATDDEMFEMLVEEDVLPVVTDSDGSILSDEDGNMLLW